ncbi:MAG: quinone oxidoreductase family protein [Segniliparus sp.]|uniref:quinone oxidoreductase family protein n=1 Tax=Segniliparus sp. TaxID=2804064 RepID=UPI003F31CBC5
MRAIQVTKTGGPEVLELVEAATPEPGAGQVLIKVEAVGVNFIDTYQRSGAYQIPLPFTLGNEGAGTVAAVGPDAAEFSVGDRVAWTGSLGGYAQYAAVPEKNIVRLPDGIDFATAAASLLKGLTAHYLLWSSHDAQPGESILVHAGAGGVGLILTQWAVAKGVRVITTAGTPEKAELSRQAGASHVLGYEEDIAARVRELTGGEGVAAVYDGVGKSTFDASLAATRIRGSLVLFGAASGPVPPFELQRLNAGGSLFVTRPTLAHHLRDRAETNWRSEALFSAIERGVVKISVTERYPLAEAATAHRDLEGRRTTGSVVLIP